MIDDLLLRNAENSRVGSVLRRGISGGQRRRVCIGVEVITNPSVLFLDEPTSGLDSYTALAIVRLLKKQTRRGRTVITTLHQPSSDIYKLFYKLIVVADGHIIYHGGPYDAITWFDRIGYKFPEYGNPADSIMRYVSLKRKDKKTEEEQANYDKMLAAYRQNIHAVTAGKTQETVLPLPKDATVKRASFGTQFRCLLHRGVNKVLRDPVQSKSKIAAGIILGLLCMALYWDLSKSTKGLNNREGFFFFSVTI
jgi:ABC-type multidrug transport system ATPase subunit